MADNKDLHSQQDRIRIDAEDPSEVEYVHRQFPAMKHEEVLDAIREKGPIRADVMKFLQERNKQ